MCAALTLLGFAANGAEPVRSLGEVAEGGRSGTPAATTSIRFVVDVPVAVRSATLDALGAVFGMDARRDAIVSTDGEPDATAIARLSGADLVVALGRDACTTVARVRASRTIVICTLLYRHAWQALDCSSDCENLLALLLDQPLPRQVRVTRAVYPALRRFGVLSADATSNGDDDITVRAPPESGALALAFEELAIENDALVVVAEPGLYDADTLRIALLSAYGRGRPVIGFGPEYVRAGALLGVWSTPRDVLDQLSDLLDDPALRVDDARDGERARAQLLARFGGSRTLLPDRFHVDRNVAVARSLGLSEGETLSPVRTFTDGDFAR